MEKVEIDGGIRLYWSLKDKGYDFWKFWNCQNIYDDIIREYDNGSYVSVETSQEIDIVSLENIIVEKLRERRSLRTQQGETLHG